ncbi:hypothetical protein ACWGLF_08885 [Streptomyces puniciscabiei]
MAGRDPLVREDSLLRGDLPVRIERGTLGSDEVAALVTALLARTGVPNERMWQTTLAAAVPLWSAGELHPRYRSPASWQR